MGKKKMLKMKIMNMMRMSILKILTKQLPSQLMLMISNMNGKAGNNNNLPQLLLDKTGVMMVPHKETNGVKVSLMETLDLEDTSNGNNQPLNNKTTTEVMNNHTNQPQ